MKKICILAAVILCALTGGCVDEGEKLVENTYTAIKNGEYENALSYGKTAMLEGYGDNKFEELIENIEICLDVREILDKNDLKAAKDKFDKIDEYDSDAVSDLVDEIEEELDDKIEEADDIIESLEEAVEKDKADDKLVEKSQEKLKAFVLTDEQEKELKKIIEEYENKPVVESEPEDVYFPVAEEIDGYIETLEEGINKYDTALIASIAVKLFRLEGYMNEHQRRRFYTRWDEFDELQKRTELPVNISPEEAIELARKALNVPSNGSIVAVQNGEYYIIRVEVDYGDYIDELGCCVSTYDGEVFGQVG